MEFGVERHIFVGEGEKRPMTQFHTHVATHIHRVAVTMDLDIFISVFVK